MSLRIIVVIKDEIGFVKDDVVITVVSYHFYLEDAFIQKRALQCIVFHIPISSIIHQSLCTTFRLHLPPSPFVVDPSFICIKILTWSTNTLQH